MDQLEKEQLIRPNAHLFRVSIVDPEVAKVFHRNEGVDDGNKLALQPSIFSIS